MLLAVEFTFMVRVNYSNLLYFEILRDIFDLALALARHSRKLGRVIQFYPFVLPVLGLPYVSIIIPRIFAESLRSIISYFHKFIDIGCVWERIILVTHIHTRTTLTI